MLTDKNFLSIFKAGLIISGMLMLYSTTAVADQRIGSVKTYEADAYVIRQGAESALQSGADIFQGDTIATDSNGAVGIIFSDGAVLTLGPNSKLSIDKFLFIPGKRQVSFVSRVIKGTIAFVSGAIGRISPGSVQFVTPTATLGLRGTKILIEVK